jgi:hypothetical protein
MRWCRCRKRGVRTKPAATGQNAMMTRTSTLLLLTIAAGSLHAGAEDEPDLLTSPACLAARVELDQARAAVLVDPPSRTHSERLNQARQEAGRACLGAFSVDQRSSRGFELPIRVPSSGQNAMGTARVPPAGPLPPGTGATPLPPFRSPTPAAVPGPVRSPSPPLVTACDPQGCWDTEGRRLERAGPLLLGPSKICTLQGNVLNCP